ncbi:MAG: c-type cytochrome [Alphaproteobacteria bacterium]|nr:c-type cytochrome [Alphaproteobacteria bacterium]
MRHGLSLFFACAALALPACSKETESAPNNAAPLIESAPGYEPDPATAALAKPPKELAVDMPSFNARRGRILFVTKGCVICHSVNGVGGTVAPALDAASGENLIKPLDFAARMWRGASAMTALQKRELGYIISLDAQDIADLAAFASSPGEQVLVTDKSVPEPLRDWFIDTPYWDTGDWQDYTTRGTRIPDTDEPESDRSPE